MKMSTLEKHFVNADHHGRRVARAMLERLSDVPTQTGQEFLEVGCGTGAAARAVAETLRLDVTGVDVDPDQIALARRASAGDASVRWVVADATELPFDDGAFDVVVTNKTLHHIDDWRRAVTECIRVLKPGGYLVVADIAPPAWAATLVGHLTGGRPATAAELTNFASSQGLRLVRRSRSVLTISAVWQRSG